MTPPEEMTDEQLVDEFHATRDDLQDDDLDTDNRFLAAHLAHLGHVLESRGINIDAPATPTP